MKAAWRVQRGTDGLCVSLNSLARPHRLQSAHGGTLRGNVGTKETQVWLSKMHRWPRRRKAKPRMGVPSAAHAAHHSAWGSASSGPVVWLPADRETSVALHCPTASGCCRQGFILPPGGPQSDPGPRGHSWRPAFTRWHSPRVERKLANFCSWNGIGGFSAGPGSSGSAVPARAPSSPLADWVLLGLWTVQLIYSLI